jgi:serine/threonine protein kinase
MLICLAQRGEVVCRTINRNGAKHCRQCGKPLRNALYLHDPDTQIGNYRIKRVIGHGGFGAVYQAEHIENPLVHVALKETFDPDNITTFQHEFDSLKNHHHDNLPHYYEMFEMDGNGYLVMEFVPGQSLQNVLNKKQGPVLEKLVLFYADQLCDVLAYLHGQSLPIIHRDIKPANVRLTPEGLIKLVDFGLLKQGVQQTRSIIRGFGTPAYEPFEQLGHGGTDQRSDIYSLGATLYHLLSGQRPPTVPDRIAGPNDTLVAPHHINGHVSPHASMVIVKAMGVYQKDRYQDIASFRYDLFSSSAQAAGITTSLSSIPSSSSSTPSETNTLSSVLSTTGFPLPIATPASREIVYPISTRNWKSEVEWLGERFGEVSGYWCYVRDGTYRIGAWEKGEPGTLITLPVFWIGRFPITVAQYETFIESGGYESSAQPWWTRAGWEWKNKTDRTLPLQWDDADYNGPKQPITGVSWYEAVAFANWLTHRLGETLPEGYVIRLPTEAEREAAEAYNAAMERCLYPWGDDDPTPEHAVYERGEQGYTASVGTCPSGAAACGAEDMAGNVWEWTTSSYDDYPYQSNRQRHDVTIGEWDIPVRGGSWWDYRTFMRCGTRDRYRPDFPSHIFGFRLVVARKQP